MQTMLHDRFFFALVNPIVALLFAAGFSLIWFRWREYRHLPTLSLAFLCLGVAFIFYDFKLLVWPDEVNIGANILYTATVSLACSSALMRKNQPAPILLFLLFVALGTLPFAWFLLVEPSLKGRIVVMSMIFAAITSTTFYRLWREPDKTPADKLFAFGVGLAFFIAIGRPSLVITGILAIDGPAGFGSSDYWVSIRAFTPIMSFIIATLFVVAMGLDVINHLKGQADRDYLTSLLNRRGFEVAGANAVQLDFVQSRQPAMLVADIDDFKKVNDTFGHKIGDAVIAAVAAVLSHHGRAVLTARMGGEEFALYYNQVSRSQLQDIARSIRGELASLRVPGLPNDYPVTLSIGLHVSYSYEPLADMMGRADQALYKAKREGKDKAVLTPVQLHLA